MDESLANAARKGDLTTVKSLLARHANPNLRLSDGSTALSWAVEHQDPALVRTLLDHGAKPSVAAATVAPLLLACQYGEPLILNMLLDAHADVRAATQDGVTPLSPCAGNAPPRIVERLIEAGAAVDPADSNGQTPLMWAAANARLDNIHVLLAHGADINRLTRSGFTPLFFALKSGDPSAPLAVAQAGGNVDYVAPDGTTAVQLAMYQHQYAFAKRMIERGANLEAFDRTGQQLLHSAVLANQPDLVKLLLAKGADADAFTGPSKVEKRYEVNFKSAPYDVPPKPPLLLAAEGGFTDIMQLLVDAGAAVDVRAADGTNVVLAATVSGKFAPLRLALRLQPDCNVTNDSGATPLHLLVGGGSGPEIGAMMKLLAERGARVDIRNNAGQTPADLMADAQADAKAAFASTFLQQTASNAAVPH